MSEWWTYTLSDFLLFTPRTYFHLFELYNAAVWPMQLLTFALGLAILGRFRSRGRAAAAILGALWLWVAFAFLLRRYATINWAAAYWAWAFVLEAALVVWFGVVRAALWVDGRTGRAGPSLLLFALLVQPFIGLLMGRGWRSLEIFGAVPDPTVVGTLGLLLAARRRARPLLMIVPVLWCAMTGLTLLAMKAPDFWIAPAAAAFSVALASRQARLRRSSAS